jgi:hypothetical protein
MNLRSILLVISGGAMVAGAVIGLICAPFMFSANIVDVTGAGLGCITGAILIAGGLRTLATLAAPVAAAEELGTLPVGAALHGG